MKQNIYFLGKLSEKYQREYQTNLFKTLSLTNDEQIKKKLIEHNLGLVVYEVRKKDSSNDFELK